MSKNFILAIKIIIASLLLFCVYKCFFFAYTFGGLFGAVSFTLLAIIFYSLLYVKESYMLSLPKELNIGMDVFKWALAVAHIAASIKKQQWGYLGVSIPISFGIEYLLKLAFWFINRK